MRDPNIFDLPLLYCVLGSEIEGSLFTSHFSASKFEMTQIGIGELVSSE